MQRGLRLMAFFQLILMLSINVGLSYYAHTCLKSGQMTILFSLTDDPCTEEVNIVPEEKQGCCSMAQEIETHLEDNCCQTEQHVLQVDDSYNSSWIDSILQLHTINLPSKPYFFCFATVKDVCVSTAKNPYISHASPILQGRPIQKLIQIYTI